jgi:hypothetical protein
MSKESKLPNDIEERLAEGYARWRRFTARGVTGTTCMQCGIELHEVGAEFCDGLCAEMHETNGERTERETIARVVAWLEKQATGFALMGKKQVASVVRRQAEKLSRGEWKEKSDG